MVLREYTIISRDYKLIVLRSQIEIGCNNNKWLRLKVKKKKNFQSQPLNKKKILKRSKKLKLKSKRMYKKKKL